MTTQWLRAALAAGVLFSVTTFASAAEGVSADVQFLFLSPHTQSRGFGNNVYFGYPNLNVASGAYDDSLQFGLRTNLAAEHCSGTGVRLRWFTFDNDISYSGAGGAVILSGLFNMDIDALDMEITQRKDFKYWSMVASGGVRYGRVDIENMTVPFSGHASALSAGSSGVTFDGAGPTVSLEAIRPLGTSGLSLKGGLRTSLLFGETDVRSVFTVLGRTNIANDVVQVWEFQLGGQYVTELNNGANFIVGMHWEAQRWDSDSNALGDLSLHGFGATAGITY